MHSIRIRSHVGPDGILKLELPAGVANSELDVVVVMNPVKEAHDGLPDTLGWPSGFFEFTAGQWAGERLVREPQGEYEVRKPLE